ncbi:MAG: squalene/phytoene synthase family protein [Verrucomicrobia bacterium]|nr:squalene/phytoene synthase family protein [Verrucomicrobiota bacterium]
MPDSLASLLRATSRSFHITLWLLPGRVRFQIGLAYPLARATDTVADTEWLASDVRLRALQQIRDRVLGRAHEPLDLEPFLAHSGHAAASPTEQAERGLLLRFEEAMAALRQFSVEDQQRIASVVDIIVSGQELDLRRFPPTPGRSVAALETFDETEDYTYRVAGCVGTFWTKMCEAHLFSHGEWDHAAQTVDGERFGKGLQWVNILRDLPRDLALGRCYLPAAEVRGVGLSQSDLLDPANWERLRPVYERCVAHAASHLDAGWRYMLRIPRGSIRLRLACAIPLVLGFRTLEMCRSGNPLDPALRIKVSRGFVRAAFVRSLMASLGLQRWETLRRWANQG